MPARVKANVKPALLVWARETAGFSDAAEAAERLQVSTERLAAWEREEAEERPTIAQLRMLAKLYRRPLAVFYLQEVPQGFMVVRDLRRLPGEGLRRFSPELLQEIRIAQQRRELARELSEDLELEPQRFTLQAALTDDPETAGQAIRDALHVSYVEQTRWNDQAGRAAFNAWRGRIEDAGVLVFQMTRVDVAEASGFALAHDVLPVITINRKPPPTRRTFTLLHEFAHLMLRVSSVSDLEIDSARPPEDQRVEVFCNHVAAAALIPGDRLLGESIVIDRGPDSTSWEDQELAALARLYGVSREALLRRLLTFQRTTDAFYGRKRKQYLAEYQAQMERQRGGGEESEFRRNMPQETLSTIGRPLVRMVLDNYYQQHLTLSEVSGYLGIRTRHVPTLEQAVGLR